MGALSYAVMNFCDVLHQNTSNPVRVPHPVSDQAHVGRANSQVIGHARIQSQVQFVDAKKMLFMGIVLRSFSVTPHGFAPRTEYKFPNLV
jgi:hypothetical protein